MNPRLMRALAAAAVCTAALSGVTAVAPADASAGSGHRARGPVLTDLGYKAMAWGTRVVVDGVDVRSLRDAMAVQRCTRLAGVPQVRSSAVSLPDNPLVKAAAATSATRTYARNGVEGVRGTSTIGDLELGGIFEGTQTPVLRIKGLTSVADAFRRADGTFGHRERFTFTGLRITHLPDQVPPELQDLLDALTGTTGQVVDQVVSVLGQYGTIDIPGLGTIGLGGVRSGSATRHSASSQTYALRLVVTATGRPTTISLGRARSAVFGPVPAGVFQANALGIDMLSGNDLVHLASAEGPSMACSGTAGRVQHHRVGRLDVLGGLVKVTGLDYALLGAQRRSGAARGFVATRIASLDVPSVQLSIDGITSKVAVRKAADSRRVRRHVATGIASITYRGKQMRIPAPGETLLLGQDGFLKRQPVRTTRTGAQVAAFSLSLPGQDSVLTLAWSGLSLYQR